MDVVHADLHLEGVEPAQHVVVVVTARAPRAEAGAGARVEDGPRYPAEGQPTQTEAGKGTRDDEPHPLPAVGDVVRARLRLRSAARAPPVPAREPLPAELDEAVDVEAALAVLSEDQPAHLGEGGETCTASAPDTMLVPGVAFRASPK